MKYEEVIYVLPRKKVLDGKGNIWEWLLEQKGWNDLPPFQKIGQVREFFKLENGQVTADIEWPAIEHVSRNVFSDEVEILSVFTPGGLTFEAGY